MLKPNFYFYFSETF